MIALRDIAVRAGEFHLSGIHMEIPLGAYGILMGGTGSGKTTLLEMIVGLNHPLSGRIWLEDRDVTGLKPAVRGLGYVPQDGALFQSMSVRDHLAFALEIRHLPSAEIKERVETLSCELGLESLLDRGPSHLSGGEKQRVALGRALSFEPQVLLLDEPLSALDEDTREHMMSLLKRMQRQKELTVLHITHSPTEAESLGDILFRIENGQLSKVGS